MKISRRSALGTIAITAAALATASAADRAPAAHEDGFKAIFDGKTLDGWETYDPSYWSIQDGAITGTITKAHPLRDNRYLIWKGDEGAPKGQLADFELK